MTPEQATAEILEKLKEIRKIYSSVVPEGKRVFLALHIHDDEKTSLIGFNNNYWDKDVPEIRYWDRKDFPKEGENK